MAVAFFVSAENKGTAISKKGFPGGTVGKESASQCGRCKRHEFDPWVEKIPWRREWATHSRILAWKIPWAEEPGGLQSMGVTESWARLTNWSTRNREWKFNFSVLAPSMMP